MNGGEGMGLKLGNARVEVRDLHPVLKVEIEGREAVLGTDAKPTIHKAGLVFVGEEFAELVGTHTITDDTGQETELVGFSDDPRLFLLYDDFLAACARGIVPPGAFPIPDLD